MTDREKLEEALRSLIGVVDADGLLCPGAIVEAARAALLPAPAQEARECGVCHVKDITRGVDWPYWHDGRPAHSGCLYPAQEAASEAGRRTGPVRGEWMADGSLCVSFMDGLGGSASATMARDEAAKWVATLASCASEAGCWKCAFCGDQFTYGSQEEHRPICPNQPTSRASEAGRGAGEAESMLAEKSAELRRLALEWQRSETEHPSKKVRSLGFNEGLRTAANDVLEVLDAPPGCAHLMRDSWPPRPALASARSAPRATQRVAEWCAACGVDLASETGGWWRCPSCGNRWSEVGGVFAPPAPRATAPDPARFGSGRVYEPTSTAGTLRAAPRATGDAGKACGCVLPQEEVTEGRCSACGKPIDAATEALKDVAWAAAAPLAEGMKP